MNKWILSNRMKQIIYKVIIVLFIISFSCLSAYEWVQISPDDIETYDLAQHDFGYPFVFACEDGLIFENGGEWFQANSGLPVWNILHYNNHEFLIIQGDGSSDDGIYKFDEYGMEFELIELVSCPNFLVQSWVDQCFYVGGVDGLYKSENGLNWEEISHFSSMNCEDMVFWGNHYAVSVSGNDSGVHTSNDNGMNWNEPLTGSPNITKMSFRNDLELLGISPGNSNFSGLWSSTDFGVTWHNEFNSDSLSCVVNDMAGNTFVGWEENDGVAKWENDNIIPMNDGIQFLSLKNLAVNPVMSIIHIIAFTNRGTYFLNDYLMSSENILPNNQIVLSNYPNPFNPSTTISFETTNLPESAQITIYNLKGQIVKVFSNLQINQSSNQQIVWNGTDQNNHPVSSGIYYYKLNIPESPIKKMILLK
jgi:hypothetical protein